MPVDGHPVVLEGVRSCLWRQTRFNVVAIAQTADEAIAKAAALSPDVVLMDFGIRGMGGLEAARRVRASCPTAKVIMFVDRDDNEAVEDMVQAGACGCIRKTASGEELAAAIERVHSGETCFSAEIAQKFIRDYVLRGGKPRPPASQSIADREREVLKLVVDGAPSKVIAEELRISIRTVEKHRQRLMKKLEVHKATDLVRFAITRGIIDVGL